MGTPLKGKLMICDFSDMSFTTIDIASRTNCPACKGVLPEALRERLVWLCGRNTANINPEKPLSINLEQLQEVVKQRGYNIRVKSKFALIFDYEKLEVSLFNGGRMLIKNVGDEDAALKAYRQILIDLDMA